MIWSISAAGVVNCASHRPWPLTPALKKRGLQANRGSSVFENAHCVISWEYTVMHSYPHCYWNQYPSVYGNLLCRSNSWLCAAASLKHQSHDLGVQFRMHLLNFPTLHSSNINTFFQHTGVMVRCSQTFGLAVLPSHMWQGVKKEHNFLFSLGGEDGISLSLSRSLVK